MDRSYELNKYASWIHDECTFGPSIMSIHTIQVPSVNSPRGGAIHRRNGLMNTYEVILDVAHANKICLIDMIIDDN